MPERAVIFANGEIRDRDRLRAMLGPDDLLIAADGGLHHLIEIDLSPSFLIGDLDSVTPEQVRTVKEHGGQVIQFSKDKNETDMQLAIDQALSLGCTEIVVAAALGGRLDQTLGNIFLLDRVDLGTCSIRLDDGVEEVFLIRDSAWITGSAGDIVSLLPLNGPVYDVKTEDLKYPLVYEKLFPDRTRGISNVMMADRARVSISRGTLICIHTRH